MTLQPIRHLALLWTLLILASAPFAASADDQATTATQAQPAPADQATSPSAKPSAKKTVTPPFYGDKLTTDEVARHQGEPGVVRLTWVLHSEENNFGFNVRRGKTKDGDYKVINKKVILGAGNSSTENVYEFYDHDVKVGDVYYYYVEDISLDGVVTKFSPSLRKLVDRVDLGAAKKGAAKPAAEDKATTGGKSATVESAAADPATTATCPMMSGQGTTATCPMMAAMQGTTATCPMMAKKPSKTKARKTAER